VKILVCKYVIRHHLVVAFTRSSSSALVLSIEDNEILFFEKISCN